MKKILVIMFSLLILSGCKSNSISNLDMKGAESALDNKYSNMISMEKSELEAIYSLDTSKFEDYIIKSSTLGNGNFYAIIKVSDSNKKDVQNQMENMFKILVNQSNLYSPEAVNLLKNRLQTSIGNYLIYIVSDDNNAYYEIVKEYID